MSVSDSVLNSMQESVTVTEIVDILSHFKFYQFYFALCATYYVLWL